MDRLHHDKDVAGSVFDFGPLIAMAAILDMEWVEMVSLRENIQLGIIRVLKIAPGQTRLLPLSILRRRLRKLERGPSIENDVDVV